MSGYRYEAMSFYLCVFLPVWCLPSFLKSAQYDVCMPVLYLPSSMLSAQLYDVCLLVCWTVWCLPACMLSVQLYDVCLPIWCLPNCMISSYPYGVCSTVSCMHTCLIFAQLYDVCLPVWCLLYCTVWCLYDIRLTNPIFDIKVQSDIGMIQNWIEKLNTIIGHIKSNTDAHLCTYVQFLRNIW